jgi:exopolysaccharide production protein ExoQ
VRATLTHNTRKASPLLWLGSFFDKILPTLTFLTAIGTFGRLGVDSQMWLSIYAITAYQVVTNFSKFRDSLITSWLLFLVPILTLVSTFWSAAPGHTFWVSLQFIYTTIIGLWLGAAYSPQRIFIALCVATGFGVAASVLNGWLQIISAYSSYNGQFIGIFGQKNILGRVIVLLSLSLFVVGIRLKHPLTAAFLVMLLWIPLSAAESATSLIMFLLVLALPVAWIVLTGNDRLRLIVLFTAVGAALLVLVMFSLAEFDLIDKMLNKLGKDSTLTGRTYIWSVGLKMFEWKPLFGIGFDAFWHAGIFEEPRQIYAAYEQAINGFHNTYLEVLVSLGLFGEAIFILTMVAVLYRLSVWLMLMRTVESLGALFLVLLVTAMSFVEIIGFRNHDVSHILIAAFFAIAHRELLENRAANYDQSSGTVARESQHQI